MLKEIENLIATQEEFLKDNKLALKENSMNQVEITEIQQIELEINFYKEQTVQSIFEIGTRLIKAKELVAHGEWENWLKEKVSFSTRRARQFMQVTREFSNRQASSVLTFDKMLELSALGNEEREVFIDNNPVEDMTTRELRQAIKDKKELEKKVEELENQEPQIVEIEVEKIVTVTPRDYQYYKDKHHETSLLLERAESRVRELNQKTKNQTDPIALEKLRNELSAKTEEIFELKKEIKKIVEVDSQVVYEKKLKDTALIFCTRVHSFLNDTGGLAWLTDYIDELEEYDRNSYMKALNLIEGWVMTVKANITKEEN